MLLFIMISSSLALVPQDVELRGGEILIIAVPLMVITLRNQLKFRRQSPDSPYRNGRVGRRFRSSTSRTSLKSAMSMFPPVVSPGIGLRIQGRRCQLRLEQA